MGEGGVHLLPCCNHYEARGRGHGTYHISSVDLVAGDADELVQDGQRRVKPAFKISVQREIIKSTKKMIGKAVTNSLLKGVADGAGTYSEGSVAPDFGN